MAGTKSILVVDDEINLRRTLAYILEKAGYSVAKAADGAEAFKALKAKEFDLVLVDLQLPDIEGIKLTEHIHKINKNTPVIILTAHPVSELDGDKNVKEVSAYLVKPIDPSQILRKIEEVFSRTNK